jgi:hypothetical protein
MTTETIVDTTAKPAGDAVVTDKTAAAVVDAGKAPDATGAKQGDVVAIADKGKTAADAADTRADAVAKALPDNWRQLMAGDNAEALKLAERYASPQEFARATVDAAKKLREKGATITPPGKDAKPEEIAAWRQANDIPETPDKYEIKLSDNRQIGDADKPVLDAFAPVAHEVGLSQTQVSRLVDWQLRRQEEEANAQLDIDEEQKANGTVALKEEWGPADFKRNMGAISELVSRAQGEVELGDGSKIPLSAAILNARLPNGVKLGNEPSAVKFLVGLGLDLVPLDSQLPPGHSEGSVSSRLEEIRTLRRTDIDKYNADPKIQAEERKLIEIEARSRARNKAA